MNSSLPSRDLVLIGAGHTNLHVVRMWRMQPIPDVRLSVVSPFGRATYSGMLPGTLAGLYRPDEMEIDLYRLAESCGARLLVDEVVGFDPEIRRVLFADRPPLRYDVASIGIGSVPGQRELWAGNPAVLSIKPMATFRTRFEKRLAEVLGRANEPGRAGYEQETAPGNLQYSVSNSQCSIPAPSAPPCPPLAKGEKMRIVVVGAGAGGTEVAFGLEAWMRGRGIDAQVSLVDGNPEILAGYSRGTVNRARREFARRGIPLHVGRRVTRIHGNDSTAVVLDDGTPLAGDIIIWATAAAPPPVLANFRLPKTDDGFLAIRPSLQTTAGFPVFAVGDSASLVGERLPKAGVYAVREGPILWENLQRIFGNRELIPYEPQRGFLSLLSTGDGRAIAEYKGLSGHGRWAWKWKDHIDRKFMRMYQDYTPRQEMARRAGGGHPPARWSPRKDASREDTSPSSMRCGGCGGKIGANILSAALQRLNLPHDRRTSLGLATPDDAAVLDRHAAPVDVLSVDFFPAFLDDPYLVGRIAALNALSDLWAMGSEPLGAMAIVTLPEGSPTQQTELLYQLLAGGLRELTAAGATLWGGHTTEGPELTIGYTVAGKLGDHAPFTKANLQPGDKLILTKPLGSATLLAAHRLSQCQARWMDALLAQMLHSNAGPALVARAFDVRAVTDVTGFGLAGHLLEMLDASRVSARLTLGSIPLLAGFAELNAAGVRSSLDPANRASESRCRADRPELKSRPEYHALFDPQTSGGLLLGVPAARASDFLEQLRRNGVSSAVIVGEVLAAAAIPVLELRD
ncbi:MAG: selenide, water dikinase SelD [Deltaproteobacteria bacterium]